MGREKRFSYERRRRRGGGANIWQCFMGGVTSEGDLDKGMSLLFIGGHVVHCNILGF